MFSKEVLISMLFGLLRLSMGSVSAWLIANNVATKGQVELLLLGLAGFIGTVIWMWKDKIRIRIEALTGLKAPEGTTMSEVKEKIAQGVYVPASTPDDAVPRLVRDMGSVKPPTPAAAWLLPFLLTGSLAGCSTVQHARFPELSPEGKVAVIGRQFVAATSEVATTIDTLITSGVLTKEQGVAVLTRLKPVGAEAQRLSAVLILIDDARTDADRNAGLQQAVALIRTLQKHVGSAAIPISSEAGREKVSTLLSGLADLLISISLVLPGHQTEALAS